MFVFFPGFWANHRNDNEPQQTFKESSQVLSADKILGK